MELPGRREQRNTAPDAVAAREFFEHMNTDAFKRSFPTLFSWVFRGSQFLPDWLYYRLFA